VAAELVSGSIALIGAELAELLREHNTKKRMDHLVHLLVALAAEAAAAEAAAAEAAAAEAV
jgi:CRISPR/Cas system-associated endonuclease Cas1